MADETTANNLPAPPGGIVNPGANAYVDQTGNLRATLAPDVLQSARADWVDIFDRGAREAKFFGKDLSGYSPEARVAWVARFDAAAAGDKMAPVEPPSAEMIRHHQEHLMPIAPKAEDYNPFYGDFLKDEGTARLSAFNAEVTGWAAEMHLEPALGTAIIERLVELGPKLEAMSPEARTVWADQQARFVLQKVGTEEALAELKQRAKAVLGAAKGNTKFSAGVANSLALNDAWLLQTLANHSRAVEAFSATRHT